MTSQLNVDTIVDKAGSGGTNVKIGSTSTFIGGSATLNLPKGVAKLTANVRQDGANEENSNLNVSSVEDGATGINAINTTNAFSAALAAVALGTIHDGSYNRGINIDNTGTSGFVTRAFTSSSGALTDSDSDTAVAIFGDLA
jgi:hypothetical protein